MDVLTRVLVTTMRQLLTRTDLVNTRLVLVVQMLHLVATTRLQLLMTVLVVTLTVLIFKCSIASVTDGTVRLTYLLQ